MLCCFSCRLCGWSKKGKPARFGYGITTMPGWQLKNSKTSLHAVLGYSRFNFKNGGGNTNFFQLGAQVRQSFNKESEKGFWAGGEISYLDIINKIDNDPSNPHASAFTIGGIAGYRFKLGPLPFSIYLAPAFCTGEDSIQRARPTPLLQVGFTES